jgi:hypothetical protein
LSRTAIVTPSYAPDFERCRLLVDSVAHCAPELSHYLIIDRRDLAIFAELENDRTHIIASEDLLSRSFIRLPTRRSIWFNRRGLPVRGWIAQQMLKIAAANAIEADRLVYADSDVAFIRRFAIADLEIDGRPGLLDVPPVNKQAVDWSNVACHLLGLDPATVPARSHVGNMIVWRRDNALAMQRAIEDARGMDWQQAVARAVSFSEYTLYGCFVRARLGYAAAGQVPSDVPLIKASWGVDLSTPSAVGNLFADLDPRTIGVMAHSKDRVDLRMMRQELERQWVANGLSQ